MTSPQPHQPSPDPPAHPGPVEPERNSLAAGDLVLGRFKIVRAIGFGGMGDVYEAIDLELGRIALKTIRPEIAANPEVLARFRREVQLARKVSGPHVCRIHELFVAPGDASHPASAFLTMEFLDGVTLADRLSDSGPLSWPDAQAIALQICAGLEIIHQAGIVHRDLKGRNIMLASRNGAACAVLMDFGLASEVVSATAETVPDLTRPGAFLGTPDYMAPEQFQGLPVTPATDIYALGIVLYELVTGKQPFAASTPYAGAVLRARTPSPPSSLQRKLPHRSDEIIGKCVEFDPLRRYQSAQELARALQPSRSPASLIPYRWRRTTVAALILLALFAFAAAVPAVRERLQGMLLSSHEKHIAILPFEVEGSDPETVALGDGLMDSLSGRLSNLDPANQSLWVVPASEVRARKVLDPSSALREFRATIAVKGRFGRVDRSSHLQLTLIDTGKMREIGFVDVSNQAGDLAALQDEAVGRLARLMNISAATSPASATGGDGRMAPAAYEDYLTGLGYFQRFDKAGNLDRSISAFQSAVDTDPRFALGFARIAQAYIMKYQLDSNPEWLGRARQNCKQAAELDSRVPTTYVAQGAIHEITGEHDLAAQEYQRALDLDPRDAQALVGMASSYQSAGRNAEAESAYLKAAALRPEDWEGYNSLGIFYDQIGRPRDAIAQYLHALKLTPDNFGIYSNLALAYMDSDDPKMLAAAEDALKKSIAISPTYTAYGDLAVLYNQQHRFNEAVAASRKAIQLNDQSSDVWINLTMAYEWLKDDDHAREARIKALDLLEQEVKIDPQDEDGHASLANLQAKAGFRDKATANIQISLALSPGRQYVLSQVADAYELLGDRPRAVKYLAQALAAGLTREQLNGDPDVQAVLSDPRFRSLAK